MYALVTGASSGIGLQYATQLARDYHYDLLLVSNQEKELQDVAIHLADAYGVQTIAHYADLSKMDAADEVHEFCKEHQIEVDVLINNAGMLIFNPLCKTPMPKVQTIMMLHMVTLTKLCKLFGQDMIERVNAHAESDTQVAPRGYILNMSSMSAWMAMPGIQCYNATKGYVLNFSKSFWYEMKPYGVHVLAMTPGSTDTGMLPFPPKASKILRAVGITMSPEKLVHRALYVLFHSTKKRCMPGAWNYIIVPIINHLPDWVVFTAMKHFKMFDK